MLWIAQALSQDQNGGQAGKAGCDVDDRTAGEIERAHRA
jgi:hypothetical protein